METINKNIFTAYAVLTVLSLLAAVGFETVLPAAIPVLLLVAYVAIVDFRRLFFLLLACIPFSIEYTFPNGFGTDLPTEPLIVGLMLVYFLYAAQKGGASSSERGGLFFRHPISLLIILSLTWALVTTANSLDVFLSVKYLLAKLWYIVTFFFLAGVILKEKSDVKQFFWTIFIPLSIAVLITTGRHAAKGFSFQDVNYVMQPMFRNHVSYGCILAVFLPFIVLALSWTPRHTLSQKLLIGGFLLFLLAIQLSFTRAAYGAVLGAGAFYFVVKYRWTRYVVAAAIVFIIGFVGYLTSHDKYLDYAPRFDRTITHQNFDNLLEATAKGEDISTMERVYRWVAGFQMVSERPLTGFGPNNFFNFYKSYTVTKFKTYVSDNPDGSTVHCYYLLMAIEQGIPGMLLFFVLIFYVLLRGERIYHKAQERWQRNTAMAALLSFVTILILILINDLIETDKIGSFFFMNLAILTNLDIGSEEK
ncbi:MAG: O-antigen ligase family protein [Saprospiraceae bacterium]|nr:O-antigen ligase family protein [Saprospiraceae bacterium]